MNKQDFSDALNRAFPNAMVNYSPDFWNFIIESDGQVWRIYLDKTFVEIIENREEVERAIQLIKNSIQGNYKLTIDPSSLIPELQDGNELLIKLQETSS